MLQIFQSFLNYKIPNLARSFKIIAASYYTDYN